MNKATRFLLAACAIVVVNSSLLAQSPAGVSTNLKLWLKANTGVSLSGTNVTAWLDQSLSASPSNAIIVGSSTTYPKLATGTLNNNPVVRFTGTSKGLMGSFANSITNNTTNAFIVVKMQTTSSAATARAFAILRNNSGNNYDYNNNNSAVLFHRTNTTDIGTYRNNTQLNTLAGTMDSYQLLSNSFGSNSFKIFKNGAQAGTTTYNDANFDARSYTIGCSYENGYTDFMQGDIAEVILYNGALTAAEKNRIDSYLATKYGFTLDQTVATNYIINGSTIAWNASNNSKLYNKNITGIGRSDASGFNQLKSETINADSIVTISTTSFANDNSYFFIGDNGTAGTATTGGITTFTSRANRVWNVQTTGTMPTITFTVDLGKAGVSTPYGGFSTSTVRLLVSGTNSFTAATPLTPTSVVGNIATFTASSSEIANGNFFTIGLVPAAGYIYLHNKILNEETAVNFSYSIAGGTSAVSSVILNDTSSLLNVFDLGASHGQNGGNIGDGQLWAVAGPPGSVTPTISTATASSPHNTSGNKNIYMRAAGSATWVATGQTGFTLDGADYNSMVYANVAGNGYFYTYGGSSNLIYNRSTYSSSLKDIAYGGGITVAVNGSGHILVYKGTYANNSDVWTDISGTNTSMVAERIDILPSTGKIVFQNSSGNVSTVNTDGSGLVAMGRATGTNTPGVRDVCFDDNGNIYASFREPYSNNDHVYDYIGGVWTLNPQSRICNSLTGGVGGQVWGVNFQDGSAQNAIFTRTTDGSRTWLNDERARVGLNDNSAMIAVMPGTYTVTETLPNASVWDLNNVTNYDPSPNSTTGVANNIATIKVNAGEIVHSVFTNENIVITTIANSCDVQNLQDFGSGSAQFGTPIVGSTSYHYTASVIPQDGLYTLEKNAVGTSGGTGWWIQGNQFIDGDHTTGAGGNGYFMLTNASYAKDEFYRQRVRGLIIGQQYQLSLWAANVSIGTQIKPNILFGIADINSGSTMGALSTGDINYGYWTQYKFYFTATKTTADIFLRNNSIGGNGNDIVIDDIALNLPPSSFAEPIVGSSIICSNTLSSFNYTTPSTTGVWSISNNLLGVLTNEGNSSVTFTPTVGATGTCTITYTITTGACVSSVTKDITLDNNCFIGTRTIGGTVFNDRNGLVDNTVNGTGTNGGGLNAVVYNNTTGKIQAIMAVPSTGIYSFSGLPNSHNYSIIITTATYTPNTIIAKPVSVLPTNYGSVGENYLIAAGSDGNPNGILDLGIVSTNVTQADFGIEQKPTANPATKTAPNPGGTNKVIVPTLTGSDPEDGTYTGVSLTNKIQIRSLPDFGKLYYNGVLATVGQIIPSYEPGLLVVDPNDGDITGTFTYSQVDSAGLASDPAIVTMTFTALSISGSIWDDGNGNAVRDGAEPFITDGSLWANLVNPGSHDVLQSVQVDNAGNYSLTNADRNITYEIILTTSDQSGNTNLVTSSLPTGWKNTGVNLSGVSDISNQTGKISVPVATTNITAQNFAIEQLPTVGSGSNSATNPGGTASVTVPANTFTNTTVSSDADGSVTSIRITAFPTGATSITVNNQIYTSITFPVGGITVPTDANGYPAQAISIDPSFTGTGNTVISFVAIDNAGKESATTGTATIAFAAFTISGNVWDDANGNAIKDGAEPFIINGSVWVNLVDPITHDVKQSVVVNSAGDYTFTNVLANTAYELILSTSNQASNTNLTTATVPTGWVNTGTNLEGIANTTNPVGVVSLTTGATSLASQNFGIEKLPVAGKGTNSAVNLGGTASTDVPANTFTNTTLSSDADGNVASIRITAFPTGADKIIINGVPYTSTDFPTGGVTVPTDANGNPLQTIAVDPSFTGAGSVVISFVAIDNAGKEGANTGTATMNFSALVVSGSVWNDANGNAVKESGEPFIITGNTVWANLVDPATHLVIQSSVVSNAGTYTFSGVPANTTYQIILTNSVQAVNASLTAATLPTGFGNTGTNLSGTANTTNQTGIATVATTDVSLSNQNLGIEKLPVAGKGSNSAVNPGGSATTDVPANTFTKTTVSSDADGNVASIRITTFPTDADKIVINGVPYTSGNFPAGGVVVPTDANGNPTQTIAVDPSFTGAGSIVISFVAIDNAGKESANTGTATMNFTALVVSGNVWDDANGNATKDGGEAFITNGSVYANLVDPVSHNVIQSVVVDASGNYSFSGVPANTAYQIILSNGNEAGNLNLVASTLPAGFANTGTNTSGTASTTNQTGIIPVTTGATSLASQNFGIEKLPIAGNGANTAINPGSNTSVTVPANTFTNGANSTDADGTVTSIRITNFPAGADKITINGVPYTSANFPAGGVTVPTNGSGLPSQTITVDPSFSDAGSISISFVAIDNAGKESSLTGAAVMTFTGVTVSGSVWNDTNGNAVKNTGEPFITNGSVFANLVDPVTHDVIQSVIVDASGNYSFTGVAASNSYEIILSASNEAGNLNLVASTLPAGFANTGTNINGTASTANQTGIINVILGGTGIAAQNFGIEQLPTAGSGSNTAVNPGGTATTDVPANTFTKTTVSSDVDGNVASIRITTFPTGADKIIINGVPYTSANFPAGGVTVPTDANGNPTQTIKVDPSFTGDGSVVISFVAIDNAGKESANTGTATMNITALVVSGSVWNDTNGNATKDASEAFVTNGSVYANLVDPATHDVLQSVVVDAAGNYSFSGVPANTAYQIILSAGNEAGNLNLVASTLPAGFGSTGTNINGTASTVNQTSIIGVTTGATSLASQNFGIEQLPVAGTGGNSAINPGGTATTDVPANTFTNTTVSSDVDGNVASIRITTFPTGADKIIINGVPYTSANFPAGGVTVPTDANGNPTQTIKIDPSFTGDGSVVISFVAIDNAGKESANTGTATMNFTALVVSGSVWNDTNGNATKDASEAFITNGSVYANLVDPTTHDVLQSVVVDASGNYSFSGVPANTTYQIILSAGNEAGNLNLLASTLPAGFGSTGTNINGTASTVNQTGIISVTTGATSLASQNFGIEQLPVAGTGGNSAINPGGTATTDVPANTFTNTTASSDIDGNVASIRITTFPTGADKIIINGVPYTSTNFPVGGVTVPTDANGNPTQTIKIDPSFTGDGSIVISFVAIDNAGKESANTGTATMNFTALVVSGNVWNDTNGNAVKESGEALITNGSVYANLVDPATHDVLQSVVVDAAGNYSFSGVPANTAYQIILSAGNEAGNLNLVASTLPAGFGNTGTNINGTASTVNQTGIIIVTTGTTSLASQNFGIEHLPTAGSGSNDAINPGGTATTDVPANTFTKTTLSSDVDGNVASIRITTFPTGADKIIINGVPYTSASFPLGGVTIPTDANGNPTQTIKVDPSFTGEGSVAISFVAIDNAGKESANTGTATLNFSDLTISGHVYDDLNGITDGLINGTPVNIASGQQLYANLVNHATGMVVGSVAVAANGSYVLGGANGVQQNTNYDVVISTVQNSATSTLPTGWVSTAEGSGSGDGNVNGIVAANITTSSINSNVDFGLDQTPTANPVTAAYYSPGGAVVLPVLNGSDPEQGIFAGTGNADTIIINTLPSKGDLYYNGIPVVAGDTIKNYNPALLTYDPSAGAGTITFTYSEVDAALKSSTAPAFITLNIVAPNLSPVISFLPGTIIGATKVNVIASVSEFNNVATTGLISVYIPKDNIYTLNYDPTATTIGSTPVANSIWHFDNTSNPSFYILTTNSVIPANGNSNFGFTTMVNPNNSVGQFRISIIILDYSGGELGPDAFDNSDDDTLIYKY